MFPLLLLLNLSSQTGMESKISQCTETVLKKKTSDLMLWIKQITEEAETLVEGMEEEFDDLQELAQKFTVMPITSSVPKQPKPTQSIRNEFLLETKELVSTSPRPGFTRWDSALSLYINNDGPFSQIQSADQRDPPATAYEGETHATKIVVIQAELQSTTCKH